MAEGGFDVIIGNPPYVEYKDVQDHYQVVGFETIPCGDLYSFTTERSTSLAGENGRVGLIVPISIFGTDGFATLQQHCLSALSPIWASSFANRPSQLFDGAQKRLTIVLANRKSRDVPDVFTTEYFRWKQEERSSLFPSRVKYATRNERFLVFSASLEKLGQSESVSIFSHFTNRKETLKQSLCATSEHKMYFTRKFGYFLAFLDRIPKMVDIETNEQRLPSELKQLCFGNSRSLYCAIGILSSSTFFWFWNCLSDCRNLNKRDLLAFPLSPEELSKKSALAISNATKAYLSALYKTSHTMTKSGSYIETFDYRSCKELLDRIDDLLGEHFGLSCEEVDVIKSYDVKYRVGIENSND